MNRHKPLPQHALYIRYGKFQLGAIGRPAIVAIIVIVAGVIARNALGW
jgi:hypothetical protein